MKVRLLAIVSAISVTTAAGQDILGVANAAVAAAGLGNAETSSTGGTSGLDLGNLIRSAVGSPETIDFLTKTFLGEDSPLGFLGDDLKLRPKSFQAGDETSLGISWEYEKSFVHHQFSSNGPQQLGLDLNLKSEGNIAFQDDVNPKDFLKAQVSFAFYRSQGGIAKHTKNAWTDDDARTLIAEAKKLATITDPKELLEARRGVDRVIGGLLGTQVYFEAATDIGYETDQRFDNQQWTLGGHAAFEVKAWNSQSALAKFNFLDYPFALTRLLTGSDDQFSPSGAALPTFLVGLDQVVPTATSAMARGGDSSDFLRFRAEVSNRSIVADNILGEPIFFETNLRFYQELDPSPAVKAADADTHYLFTAALLLPRNTYVSYSNGEMPFDLKNEQVFELGFNYDF